MSVRIGMCDWSFPITGIGGIRFASELGIKSYQLTLGPRTRGYPLTEQELQKKYLECGEKYGVEFVSINVFSFWFSFRPCPPLNISKPYSLTSLAMRRTSRSRFVYHSTDIEKPQ